MGYTTSDVYQTHDRIIIDIRRWTFSIWKRPKFWRFDLRLRWACNLQAGPLEITRRERREG